MTVSHSPANSAKRAPKTSDVEIRAAIDDLTAALGIDPRAERAAPRIMADELPELLKDFTREEIEGIVAPKRTLARRASRNQALTAGEIDRALRLARIRLQALRTFGSPEKADRWLRKPTAAFSDQAPMKLLQTETGAQQVQELLVQIAHGIFI
ncbi:MAG: antitoxin Xre/MbcA/ParS toxin-binding domain-containing protein [Methylocystis sp.]|uniref:type II RES/Xre toxin-antitoxin system antitoxin n=1 Tax=Methylocystis sp. TaxID=1911079 RepID=UPI003D0BD433